MDNSNDFDDLMKEIENLKKSEKKIIVEGKFDEIALNDLGITNVFVLHKPGVGISIRVEQLMNSLSEKESVVILTDLDEQGEEYYILLKKELMDNGFKLDKLLRKILAKLKISHVEGLSSFVRNS